LAGNALNGSANDFALARYNSDGSLDTGFDSDGKATTDFGSTDDIGYSMAIQSNGKIIVAGSTGTDIFDTHFGLARYNTDGSLDTTFSGDGKVVSNPSNFCWILNIALQADGKIVAAARNRGGTAFARYNTDGSLDTSFDGDGIMTTTLVDRANAVVSRPHLCPNLQH